MSMKGEKYASAKAMRMHEGSESASERKKEYGVKKPATKGAGKTCKNCGKKCGH